MSYEWYKVEDARVMHRLRDEYVRAVRGLIDCRRGDEKALRSIFLIPATETELRPVIDEAIRHARK